MSNKGPVTVSFGSPESKAAEKSFEVFSPGTYPGFIYSAELRESKSSPGSSYVRTEINHAEEGSGKKFYQNFSLRDDQQWRLKRFFNEVGAEWFPDGDIDETIVNETCKQVLVGQAVWVDVEIGEYNGKPQNNVRSLTVRDE